MTSTQYWLSWMLITRKGAHVKVISELHDSMNWKKCRIFEIYRFGLKTVILSQKIQHFNIAHTSILSRTGFLWFERVVEQICMILATILRRCLILVIFQTEYSIGWYMYNTIFYACMYLPDWYVQSLAEVYCHGFNAT